jgi:hypothetical protein
MEYRLEIGSRQVNRLGIKVNFSGEKEHGID